MMRRCMMRLCAAERMVEEFDVAIIGGGPAGLSAAIRLKQLAKNPDDFRVAIVEKGSEIGQHTLSGACIETHAIDELLPGWRENHPDHPIQQKVTTDSFYLLNKTGGTKSPWLPPTLHNEKNYIVSLGSVCKWLGEQAEALGVEIYPGFAAAQPVYGEKGNVEGVQLNDVGINKKGEEGPQFDPGMIFKAKQTIFAEGCRGSCTKQLEDKYKLRSGPQSYGLGVKEVWEVPKEKFNPGSILHTCGWPLTKEEHHDNTYGGSFMYHYGDNLMSVGFVVGLDYSNPYTRPYMEFQKWKTHPMIAPHFEGAKPLSYGARTLVEGGITALPKLSFNGGVLIGDCAGFLNLPKIKGTHTAMKSGMLAAEAIHADVFEKHEGDDAFNKEAASYHDRFKKSWVHDELHMFRNVRQIFAKNFYMGALYTGVTAAFTKGMEPITLPHKHWDHECLKPAKDCKPIEYPKPDGKLTFDLLTNHARSGTAHNADQPSHLRLKKWEVAAEVNKKVYDGPVAKTCPAGVYEWMNDDEGKPKLVINAQNCLHCKACDIKDPTQNINWCTPEGGGGPNYNASM